MTRRATITVLSPRDELERRWRESEYSAAHPNATFKTAPGDRGTEIHIEVEQPNVLAQAAGKLTGSDPHAKAMDALRRFKQLVETREIARSEAVPQGELVERKFKQRPAQPLEQSELDKAGV